MSIENQIRTNLEANEVYLSENLGQHILIDEETLELIGRQVIPGGNVIEIGSGPGNLTAKLTERANRVVGIEIDRQFAPVLEDLQSVSPNLQIVYGDALRVNFQQIVESERDEEWQVVSNLPFHISEPFLKKVAGLPVENVVLVVGDALARSMQIADPDSGEFSRTSFLSQTFFETSVIADIKKSAFYPPPRTNATAVVLTPRERDEFKSNPRLAIQHRLFLTEHKSPTVGKVIKEARDNQVGGTGKDSHRSSRRKARQELKRLIYEANNGGLGQGNRHNGGVGHRDDSLGLDERIISTPFSRLNNQEVRDLAKALRDKFGQ